MNIFYHPKMLQNLAMLLVLAFILFMQLGCTFLEVQVHTSQRMIRLEGNNDRSTLVRGNDEFLTNQADSLDLNK